MCEHLNSAVWSRILFPLDPYTLNVVGATNKFLYDCHMLIWPHKLDQLLFFLKIDKFPKITNPREIKVEVWMLFSRYIQSRCQNMDYFDALPYHSCWASFDFRVCPASLLKEHFGRFRWIFPIINITSTRHLSIYRSNNLLYETSSNNIKYETRQGKPNPPLSPSSRGLPSSSFFGLDYREVTKSYPHQWRQRIYNYLTYIDVGEVHDVNVLRYCVKTTRTYELVALSPRQSRLVTQLFELHDFFKRYNFERILQKKQHVFLVNPKFGFPYVLLIVDPYRITRIIFPSLAVDGLLSYKGECGMFCMSSGTGIIATEGEYSYGDSLESYYSDEEAAVHIKEGTIHCIPPRKPKELMSSKFSGKNRHKRDRLCWHKSPDRERRRQKRAKKPCQNDKTVQT